MMGRHFLGGFWNSALSSIARLFVLLLSLSLSQIYQASATSSSNNTVPVIGILSQPVLNGDYQYIAASYAKWLESAGAMSIVIPYDADESLTLEIFSQINAVLFPGGRDTPIPLSARLIWDLAVKHNQRGEFFPIWGTCLGFEYMIMMAGGEEATIEHGFNAENVSIPLVFPSEEDEVRTRGVFSTQSDLYPSKAIRDILSSQNITMNNHQRGITPSYFLQNVNLTEIFRVTSTNADLDGKHFVSTIESIHFPFYGVQYHPEKNNFEYGLIQQQLQQQLRQGHPDNDNDIGNPSLPIPFEAINHSEEAIDFSIRMSRFFVSQARKSTIGKYTLVEKHPPLYNYPVEIGKSFEQLYKIPLNGGSKFQFKSSLDHEHGILRGTNPLDLTDENKIVTREA